MAAGPSRRWAVADSLADTAERDIVVGLLHTALRRLRMDLCLVSRLRDDDQVVDVCVGDPDSFGIVPGASVRFASHFGSCVNAPINRPDGRMVGMLTCVSHRPRLGVGDADERFVTVLADALSHVVAGEEHDASARERTWWRIRRLIDSGGPGMVFQPVFDLPSLDCVGAEALARFPPPFGPAQEAFAEAASVGLGTALELSAIEVALDAFPGLPAEFGIGVNASPATVLSGRLEDVIAHVPADRLVLEITEHDRIDDWPSMRSALGVLRDGGVRIAVDDVGVGYAGMQQLIQLLPDFVKMDQCLTRGIDVDPGRRALARALVHFTHETNGLVLAEGIETAAELGVLVGVGVQQAQGRYLAPPGPLPLPPSANRTDLTH